MDVKQLAVEFTQMQLVVGCTHGHAAISVWDVGSWTCASGGVHKFMDTVLAEHEWAACMKAVADALETDHPASIAEFRRAQRELVQADVSTRAQVARTLEMWEEQQRPLGQRLTNAFLRGLLG